MTKTWARIQNNTVIETFVHPVNPKPLFVPSWVWVECPADTLQGAVLDGDEWTNPEIPPTPEPLEPLDAAKAAKVLALSSACEATILSGFSSEALGSQHRYPSGMKDQINLMGSVTDSLLPGVDEAWSTPFWCVDENGLWLMRPHTAEQIQTAGRNGKAHVVVNQQTLDALIMAVQIAATIEDVAAVVWP